MNCGLIASTAAAWTPRPAAGVEKNARRYWSHRVMQLSNALDLEPEVFTWSDPKRIARSLKHPVEASTRRKAGPFQSAVSMLNFHINRGGKNITTRQKRVLELAKTELRRLF